MTVIYHERKEEYKCTSLTEGKEYKVLDTVTIPDEGEFYMIIDDYEEKNYEEKYRDACPYSIDMFEIKKEDKVNKTKCPVCGKYEDFYDKLNEEIKQRQSGQEEEPEYWMIKDQQPIPFYQFALPMPAINPKLEADNHIIGLAFGVLSDGIPFAAELWRDDTDNSITVLLPYQEKLFPETDTHPLTVEGSNVTGFLWQVESVNYTAICEGMEILDEDLDDSAIIEHVDYLENMDLIHFISPVINGYVNLLSDFENRPVVKIIIALSTNGCQAAETPLRFDPIPGKPPDLRLL